MGPSGPNSGCLPPPPSQGQGRSRRSSARLLSRRTSSTSTRPAQMSPEQPFSLHHLARLRWPPRAAAAGRLPSNRAAHLPCKPPPPALPCRPHHRPPPAGATGPAPPTPGPEVWPEPLQSGPAAWEGPPPCSDTNTPNGSCHVPTAPVRADARGVSHTRGPPYKTNTKKTKFFEESYFSYFLKIFGSPFCLLISL